MAGPVETELKLRMINADNWRSLLSWPGWSDIADSRGWQQEHLEAQYFDTPQYDLRQAKLAYRLRFENGSWVAAVKGGGSSEGGLHQRSEWEVGVAEPVPSADYFQDTAIGVTLSEAVGDKELVSLFTTRFERHTLIVRPDEHTVIEVAVDRGAILVGDNQEPIQEIELELKEGEVGSLLALGAKLAGDFALLFEERSKYYRGLLAAGLQGKQTKAKEQAISDGLFARDGAKALVLRGLHAALREYVKSREQLQDAERLHQVRIKLRRLRALLSFVKPLVQAEACRQFQQSLRELGQMLGPIRELDVLAEYWQAVRESGTGLIEGHSWLADVLSAERAAKLEEVRRPFDEAQVTALLLQLWAWLEGDIWAEEDQYLSFRSFCLARLGDWHRELYAFGKKPDLSDAETLHKLRIAAKKLRYVLEAIEGVLDAPTEDLIERLKQLQDSLGYLRDAWQTTTVLPGLLADKSSRALQREAGILMGWQVRGAVEKQRRTEKAWRRVRRRLAKHVKQMYD